MPARRSGFTLVEVLIALAISAFVATIAYSSFTTVLVGVESTQATAERVYSTLKRALVELEPREQMILEMFYAAGCSAGTIAKTLGVTPRRLYTSKDRCIRHLRRAFDGAGLTWDEVRDILGWVEVSTPPVFAAEDTSAGQQIGHPEGEMKP